MRMDHSEAQKCLDVMFEILSRVQARDRVPQNRDEVMDWARDQLCQSGVNVVPMGLSHAVIVEK